MEISHNLICLFSILFTGAIIPFILAIEQIKRNLEEENISKKSFISLGILLVITSFISGAADLGVIALLCCVLFSSSLLSTFEWLYKKRVDPGNIPGGIQYTILLFLVLGLEVLPRPVFLPEGPKTLQILSLYSVVFLLIILVIRVLGCKISQDERESKAGKGTQSGKSEDASSK